MFWSQYTEAGHPVPLSDQLKQLVELHKAAELKEICPRGNNKVIIYFLIS